MRLAVGFRIAFLLGAAALASAQPSPYAGLVARYASGDRAAAVADLGRFDDGELARQLDAIQRQLNAVASCPSCPRGPEPPALRAAVMLHTDRDEFERRPLGISGERAPTCGPPTHAGLAEQAASMLLGDATGRDFAQRWYLAMALRSLGDVCLAEGRAWAAAGLKRFPKDKELLLTRGLIAEAVVFVVPPRKPVGVSTSGTEWDRLREQQVETHALLAEANAAYEQALAVDVGFEEAALRLGRVRHRLGQPAPALQVLGALAASSHDSRRLYLAHLFAGRIHEAEQHTREAEREYRTALAIDADGQAAAMAVSQMLLVAGHAEAAREIVEDTLGRAGSRSPDPYWEYTFGLARAADLLFEALRNEATTP